jgi:hypothetical protein
MSFLALFTTVYKLNVLDFSPSNKELKFLTRACPLVINVLVLHRKPMLNEVEFSQKSRSALAAKRTRYCYVKIDEGQSPYLQTF